MARQASENLRSHIKRCESFSKKAYRCPAGVLTCGWGHTKGVTKATTCDEATAERWLTDDLAPAVAFCNGIRQLNTQGRFDAIVDFAFNAGIGNLKESTLLRLIRGGASDKAICTELRKWVYANGRKLDGLVKRREWECERWKEGRV